MLLQSLNKAGASKDSLAKIEGVMRTETHAPGVPVLRQGEVADELYFLVQGLIKLVYVTSQGNEFIKSFISEGSFFGSLISTLEGHESTFSAVALEPVTVEAAPYAIFRELAVEDPAVLRMSNAIFQSIALKKEIREYEFLCLTPAERYQRFLEAQPDIATRITQAQLALHLGITPVALSRIKSRAKTAC